MNHKLDIVLNNVTTYAFGIDNGKGEMVIIVPKNTTYPRKISRVIDFNNATSLHIYEGDAKQIKDNLFLGRLILQNLP